MKVELAHSNNGRTVTWRVTDTDGKLIMLGVSTTPNFAIALQDIGIQLMEKEGQL